MKCPLLKITRPGLMRDKECPQDDCLGEECAWYNSDTKKCVCYSASLLLGRICEHLGEILVKMPQDEGTRRRM